MDVGLAVLALAAGMVLSACGSSGSTGATTTTGASTTTPTTAQTTTTTVPLQTPTRGEFYSPSGNISCEIDNVPPVPSIYCQTSRPPRSATLKADGSLTVCDGNNCLGNAAIGTPTLAYGTATGSGDLGCASEVSGMRCTIGPGDGFFISRSGVVALGGAVVSTISR